MANSIANLTRLPDLRKRLVFTFVMLAIYRFGVFVPTPGIDVGKLQQALFGGQSGGTIFEIVNLFSGGALEQFSIFALGIMPYISASIIFQLLTVSIPALKKLQEEGEAGRNKINQWTRYGTVALALVQGFGISYGLLNQGYVLANMSGPRFVLTTIISLAAGTCFIMWLGEQITERGIGNGISLLIFAGIVARIPKGFVDAWFNRDEYFGVFGFAMLLAFLFAIVTAVIFFERCHRRVPIHYAKRVVGRRLMQGQTSHLPLKINMAGVIPPIFASSILLFPATIANFVTSDQLQQVVNFFTVGWFFNTMYVAAIIFFTYFYTAVTFNPADVAENLQKQGGFIPGIRPGKPTSDYLDSILTKITLGGALYLAVICVVPQFLISQFNIPSSLAYTFGGTSVLIVVGVAVDTVAQMESHLINRNYEGFLGPKGGRFKGRRA
ncbi:MAG: preprotein translocase subunit SecY [Deltaproteobacteria bacterium]|nr:preprotein translocase subunit SecY [Deltaproteobacteria bacterium]